MEFWCCCVLFSIVFLRKGGSVKASAIFHTFLHSEKLVIYAFMGHNLTSIYVLYTWMILNLLTLHVIACYVRLNM